MYREISVLKFGGRSVDTPLKMELVQNAIQETAGRKIVVLSALSDVTNQLVQIALFWSQGKVDEIVLLVNNLKIRHSLFIDELLIKRRIIVQCKDEVNAVFTNLLEIVHKPHSRQGEDELVGLGEILSVRIFFYYLKELGLDVFHFPASEYIKMDHHKEPDWDTISEQVGLLLKAKTHDVFITEGFLCKNADGAIGNLGRGGSDFTASILGAALKCKEVQIWTDIDGIHNIDPRYVSETSSLDKLSYQQAVNMSLAGSKVLHPKSIMPLKATGTPVRVMSTTNRLTNGTIISKKLSDSDLLACAVRDVSFVKAHGLYHEQIVDCLEAIEQEVDVKMGELFELRVGDSWLECLVCASRKRLIQSLSKSYNAELEFGWSVISIIGENLMRKHAVISTLPGMLSAFKFEILYVASTQDRVLVKVREEDKGAVLNLLNTQLILKKYLEGVEH